ncbi:unnamed protein product [Brassica napus]|uniref:(rape) hypothetical protein n=1 Tax=Brassica napus TaxID=3708 RepID=A0A816P711_BRANA|nr:unnamed protein product [Brassica napus]
MGDDARESKRQARRRESRSMEETKSPALRFDCPERNPDFRPERRHDNKESYTDIKRRTSHEKDSKSLLLKKKKKKMATNLDRERSEPKTASDERTPSDYPVRPGQSSCRSYLHSGLCVRGSNCLFNHPRCKEKELKQIEKTEWQRREAQRNVKEHRQREGQRREAQENVQEHRQKETSGCQRYSEKKRREAQENTQERRFVEIPGNHKVDAHGQEYNLQVRRKRESIEWQTREAQEMGRRKSKAFSEEQRVKERNMDLRSSKSDVRTDRRHKRDPRICAEKRDNKDSGLRINESHQTHDHKESYADIQRARGVEMQQQGSHESESKNKVKRNSGYQVHPGERICPSYLQTGLCEHGSNCLFNHPTCKDRDGAETMRQRDNTEWQRGEAQENVHEHRQRDITECQRYYEMGRRDAQEIVVKQHRQRDITESLRYFEMGRRDAQVIVQQHRQREASGRQRYLEEEKSEEAQENDQEQRLMVTPLDGRFDERRHETESSSMAEKREELFTSLQSVFKDVIDDIAAGYERVGTEHGEGNVGRQRVEAEEIVQEQSNRDGDVL